MKHLPKHLRPRWRYFAVELESHPDATFDREAFQRALWYAAGNLLGDPGSADADLSVLRFERAGAEAAAVVRVRREAVDRGRAVLATLSAVGGTPVRTRVRGTSGTVRSCEEKYIRRPSGRDGERTVAFAGAERRSTTRGRRVDIRLADGHAGATDLDL